MSDAEIKLMLDLLKKLIRTKPENPPGREESAALMLKSELEKFGFTPRLEYVTDKRPNLILEISGDSPGPILLLNGHLDVVPATSGWTIDPFAGIIKNNKVYGRGAVDMLGGLSAMVVAIKKFLDEYDSFGGKILFTAVIDEEAGGSGTKYLINNMKIKADIAMVAEPTDNTLFICERGLLWYRFKVFGKAAHGSMPHEGVNAIEALMSLLQNIKNMKLEYTPHKYLGFHTVNIGKISGGKKINIVADYAEAEVDIRTTPLITHNAIKQKINLLVRGIEQTFDAKIDADVILEASPYELDEKSEIVQRVINAIRRATGTAPKIGGMPGATDARLFIEKGIPALIYGPAPLSKAHKDDEYVEISSLVKTLKSYYEILKEFLIFSK
ncbi:MAG: M20 family metallopeptidase [Candidatus Odinarchaeota archaeon]|nr:M20 family metallopeptidase [Candidatus Odinarchaeota archaeon]